MAKSKRYPHAFFRSGSWYHRVKELNEDFTIKYNKKGGFATPEEAEKSYALMDSNFKERLATLAAVKKKSISLSGYLLYWLNNVASPTIQSSTRMVWEYAINQLILPNIVPIKVDMVTTEYINMLLEKIAPYSKSAGNKAREVLFLAFKNAVKEGYSGRNPVKDSKAYPRGKPRIFVLNKSDAKKLTSSMYGGSWYLEYMLALFCGLRKGEIYGLKFSDVDFENRTIHVQRQVTAEYIYDGNGNRIGSRQVEKPPKTANSDRILRVPEIVLNEINVRKQLIDVNKHKFGEEYSDNDYISCQENGKPSSGSAFNSALTKACKNSGVRVITVHTLRHMFATVLCEQHVSLVKISALLGHSSIHTTFEYYCDVMDEKDAITDFLNEKFVCDEDENDEY